jgi:hypothetical protein
MRFQPTQVMTLGRLGIVDQYDKGVSPQWTTDFGPVPLVNPGARLQYRIRQTVLSGLGAVSPLLNTALEVAPNPYVDAVVDASDVERTDARKTLERVGYVMQVSGLVSLYHGYRRHNSLAWGLGWYAMGVIFPIITPVVAVAQGYGKRK